MKKQWLAFLITFVISLSAWAEKGDILMYRGAFNDFLPEGVAPYNISQHVGIDTGDGYVIEFSGGANGQSGIPKIIKTPIDVFISNSPNKQVEIIDIARSFPTMSPYTPDEVVNNAELMLHNGGFDFGAYNPIYNNCQHFVTWCIFGERFSWQADNLNTLVIQPLRRVNGTVSDIIDMGIGLTNIFSDLYYLFGQVIDVNND